MIQKKNVDLFLSVFILNSFLYCTYFVQLLMYFFHEEDYIVCVCAMLSVCFIVCMHSDV